MKKRNLEELKKEYRDIQIPDKLNSVVNDAFDDSKKNEKHAHKFNTRWLSVAASICAVIIMVNVSPAFANTLEEIPVIGNLVKLVNIKQYSIKEGNFEAKLEVPKIEGLQDKNLENRLNDEFMSQGKEMYENLLKEVPEVKNSNKYVGVDYHIKSDTDKFLSIEVTKEETQASSYTTKKHYTIDKDKQIVLTLPALFKSDKYINAISENIKEQMKIQMKNNSNVSYFIDQEDGIDKFNTIVKDQDFYINKDGNLVISFDEYEVAPGYMGAVEFVIPTNVVNGL